MQWQKKLYEHEELPPEAAWGNIQKEIADEPYLIRDKLFNMESEPPAQSWEEIRDSISSKSPAEVKPLPAVKWYKRASAYAAAVTGTAIILAGLIYLINNKENSIGSGDLTTSISVKDSPSNKSRGNHGLQSGIGDPALQNISLNAAGISYADGNYIYITAPEGGYNRVSYKFYEMVKVVYENDPSMQDKKSKAEYWDKTMDDWKEKINHSSFIPSGNNFFDLAEMITLLEENQ